MATLLHTWSNPTWKAHEPLPAYGCLSRTYDSRERFREIKVGDAVLIARNKNGMLWIGGLILVARRQSRMGYHFPDTSVKTLAHYVYTEPGMASDMNPIPVGQTIMEAVRYIGHDGNEHPLALNSHGKLEKMATRQPLWLTDDSARDLMQFTRRTSVQAAA
jgi:hypothetical protein